MKFFTVILIIIGISFSATSFARGKFIIGDQDKIHFVQNINITDRNGVGLNLSYRTTITYFIAGLYLKDQGYVLSTNNNIEESFYKLTEDNISLYQIKGLLPNPLPTYKIEISEYLLGYSLWLIVIVLGLYNSLKSMYIKRRKQC